MSKPVVLITSATSRNGSQAAKLLLAQGKHTVRLAARDPSKLEALVSQGAEAVALDPTSSESMTKACTGADFVYLILPTLKGDAEITMFRNFLQAAPSTGVKHIVYLSGIDAVPADNAAFKPIHNHYVHEQQLLTSGITFTSLRPAWFHENQVAYHGMEIKHTGEFKTSTGDAVWTSVAVQDIAAAAVVVLSDPDAHAGKIYTLTTDAVTDGMIAAIISKVTGQKVRHVNLTPEEHQEMLVKFFGGGSAAEERATGLVTLDSEKRGNLFSTVHPDLEQLLGHKGVPLEDFLAQHADVFKQA